MTNPIVTKSQTLKNEEPSNTIRNVLENINDQPLLKFIVGRLEPTLRYPAALTNRLSKAEVQHCPNITATNMKSLFLTVAYWPSLLSTMRPNNHPFDNLW